MDRRFPVFKTTATILLGAVACGDLRNPDAPTSAPRLHDSAGVRIAENPRPPAGSRLGWETGPEPAVNIGSADGGDPYLFHRVWDMATLSGGRIAVADARAQEVRIFDPSGVHLATWGGQGEGPGEFRSLRGVARWRGDSVAAWEFHGTRGVSIFDSQGKLGRILRFDAERRREDIVVLRGTAILTSHDLGSGRGPAPQARQMVYDLRDAEGNVTASLGPFPGYKMFERRRMGMTVWRSVPFSRSVQTAAWHDLAVVGPNHTYEIRAYGTDGALRRIVRMDHAPVPATRSLLALRREESGDEDADDDIPLPETLPAFDRVVADAVNHLWVLEYRVPGSGAPPRLWTVFDPEGRVLGQVETPPGLSVLEIGADYILGLATAELGVQQVQVWPLRREG